eukprot:12369732-Alexandrium_andersonii.AAC.1
MDGVEADLRRGYPLALTPVFSFPDVEYADDTVIISKVATIATEALQLLQSRAAERGLFLNMGKTKELSLHSDERVFFLGGAEVPRASSVRYLGTVVSGDSGLGPEVGNRVGQASRTFKKLDIVWKDRKLRTKDKFRIYEACVL